MVMTPTGSQEVCIAVISRDPHLRIEQALPRFPALAERLRVAIPTNKELGDVTSLTRLQAVTRNRVALVGDASGTVDAATGHGLSLVVSAGFAIWPTRSNRETRQRTKLLTVTSLQFRP